MGLKVKSEVSSKRKFGGCLQGTSVCVPGGEGNCGIDVTCVFAKGCTWICDSIYKNAGNAFKPMNTAHLLNTWKICGSNRYLVRF
jgi:hypothetical protein